MAYTVHNLNADFFVFNQILSVTFTVASKTFEAVMNVQQALNVEPQCRKLQGIKPRVPSVK